MNQMNQKERSFKNSHKIMVGETEYRGRNPERGHNPEYTMEGLRTKGIPWVRGSCDIKEMVLNQEK